MFLAFQILIGLFGLFLLLLVLLLLLPLRLRLSLKNDPLWQSNLIIWPFGARLLPIRVHDSRRKPAKDKPKTPKKKTKAGRSGRRDRVNAEAMLTLPAALGRMIRTVHIEKLRIDGEFGLGDPADTGQLYGRLTPVIYGSGAQIDLRPNFETACLRGAADLQLRVIPVAFLWPIAGFLWRMFGPLK